MVNSSYRHVIIELESNLPPWGIPASILFIIRVQGKKPSQQPQAQIDPGKIYYLVVFADVRVNISFPQFD